MHPNHRRFSAQRTLAAVAVLSSLGTPLVGMSAARADAPPPDCRCRVPDGEMRNVGTVLCLTVNTRPVMMRCEMSTNTPYWKPLGDGRGCAPA